MTRFLPLLFSILFSLAVSGQNRALDRKLSLQDSILLKNFWTEFKVAINANDKSKLAALCKFPFYCTPCIDDTTLKNNNHITIKVTKELFIDSQYKLFFDKPIKDEVNKHEQFDAFIFFPVLDTKNKVTQFKFPYTIVAPSKNGEGLEGFIFLDKIDDEYKITAIDTVP